MDISNVSQQLISFSEPTFRIKQITRNYYSGRYESFMEMTDLPLGLRQQLSLSSNLYSVTPSNILSDNFTQKALLTLKDGLNIETVLMNYDNWQTVCISSQVGCPLGCKFCATGKMGYKRNLTSEEIVDQIIFWKHQIQPNYVGRVVFMGMGEPFLNWDNLLSSIEVINSKSGLNIGARKISISTAGIVPAIVKFANLNTEINLAISLHSADQKTRESLMPVAKFYPLSELTKALDYYLNRTKRQIFFEYALIRDINDTPDQLRKLIDFIRRDYRFFLNIIPLNKINNGMNPSSQSTFDKFVAGLTINNVKFTIRHSIGQSINSACGQLIVQ